MNKAYRSQQLQHISLSNYAYNIIQDDSFVFLDKINLSGIINKIISYSWDTSNASISITAEKERERLISIIKNTPNTECINANVDLFVNGYISSVKEQFTKFPKDHSFKIRLDNYTYDLLYDETSEAKQEIYHYASVGEYIKALCENYARLSYFDREAIIHRSIIDLLYPHVYSDTKQKRILAVDYISANGTVHRFNIKPYRFSSSSEAIYNYLVCMRKDNAKEFSKYERGLLRISRIKSVRAYSDTYGSGKITEKEKKDIDTHIERNGISFLISSSDSIDVYLTHNGILKYQGLAHLRPTVERKEINEDGSAIFHFLCSKMQVENYFFSFGEDAIILNPIELKEKMSLKYLNAHKAYSTK